MTKQQALNVTYEHIGDSRNFKEWEKRVTCKHCGKPLADNRLVRDAYYVNNSCSWAKKHLRILADMAEGREGLEWFAEEIKKIEESMETLP